MIVIAAPGRLRDDSAAGTASECPSTGSPGEPLRLADDPIRIKRRLNFPVISLVRSDPLKPLVVVEVFTFAYQRGDVIRSSWRQ